MSLNSVLYVKQSEIAVADSLGRIKLWDTREADKTRSLMTLAVLFNFYFRVRRLYMLLTNLTQKFNKLTKTKNRQKDFFPINRTKIS